MLRWSGPARPPVDGRTVRRCLEQIWEADVRMALGYMPGGRRQDVTRLGVVERGADGTCGNLRLLPAEPREAS